MIRIGALEYLAKGYLPRLMQIVRAEIPMARLSILEMSPAETASAAADGRIDLGIARAPVTEPNVVARPFRRGEWMLVMPRDHQLAAKAQVDIRDLGAVPLILFSRRLNPELYDAIVGAIAAAGVPAEIAYQTQDPLIGAELAASGIGLFLSASFAVPELADGLVSRPILSFGIEAMLDIVWRRDRMTPVLRSVIDALTSEGLL